VRGDKKGTRPDEWHEKLHAVFFELAELNREFEHRFAGLQDRCKQELSLAGPTASPETQEEIGDRYLVGLSELNRWNEEHLVDIDKRHKPLPYNPLPFSYLTLDSPSSDLVGLEEYLHFHRHGESLSSTTARDAQGDLEAWDQVARTEKDLRRVVFAKGPIKPFQEDPVHRQLLQILICFEKERLTSEELAECFDVYCACGTASHEADNLRKMRNRLEADLRK
jgi:hypothetical protein